VFDLSVRRTVPLAMMPFAKLVPTERTRSKRNGEMWVFQASDFDRLSHHLMSALPKLI